MVMTAATLAGLTARYLAHTCTLTSRLPVLDDEDEPTFDAYEEPLSTFVPPPSGDNTETAECWAWQVPAQGDIEESGRVLVAHEWRIMLPTSVVVRERDQVSDIRDEAGALIVAGPLNVREVDTERGHRLIICDEATGD